MGARFVAVVRRVWSRLSARFARCSTTWGSRRASVVEERASASVSKPLGRVSTGSTGGGCGGRRTAGVVSTVPSLRSLLDHLVGHCALRWLRSERQRASRNHWVGFRQAQPACGCGLWPSYGRCGLDCPLASLAARPPGGVTGALRWLRSERQRASRNHLVRFRQAQPAGVADRGRRTAVWSRLSARFARCSTTWGSLRASVVEERASASVSKPLGRVSTGSTGVWSRFVAVVRRSGLDCRLASLAARPPGAGLRSRSWSRFVVLGG